MLLYARPTLRVNVMSEVQVPLPELLNAFQRTQAGAFAPNNIPYYLGPISQQTLLDSRAQGQQGFNAYRTAFGLEPLKRCGASTGV